MVYVISLHGDIHTIHTSGDEAESYLEDLKKVHPTDPYELTTHMTGRLPIHDKPIWCGAAIYDHASKVLRGFRRAWYWESQVTDVPPFHQPGTVIPRFQVVYLRTTEQDKMEKACTRVYQQMKVTTIDENKFKVQA
jgi:hypothetical protein